MKNEGKGVSTKQQKKIDAIAYFDEHNYGLLCFRRPIGSVDCCRYFVTDFLSDLLHFLPIMRYFLRGVFRNGREKFKKMWTRYLWTFSNDYHQVEVHIGFQIFSSFIRKVTSSEVNSQTFSIVETNIVKE